VQRNQTRFQAMVFQAFPLVPLLFPVLLCHPQTNYIRLPLKPNVKNHLNSSSSSSQPANPKSLISMMIHNVKTMQHVPHTHAKFIALTMSSAPLKDGEQGLESGGMYGSSGTSGTATRSSAIGAGFNSFGLGKDNSLVDKIDEEPWTIGGGKKGKSENISRVELEEANATDCLHQAGNKILEHAGFQGMF
jgi:transcriptional activator SPT7